MLIWRGQTQFSGFTLPLYCRASLTSLEPTILENLDDLPTKLTSRQLEELRSFKQRLSQDRRVREDEKRVRHAIDKRHRAERSECQKNDFMRY